jgi:hypothetical protein
VTNDIEIRWEDPPPPPEPIGAAVPIGVTARLKGEPGRWARVMTYPEGQRKTPSRTAASSYAWMIRSGKQRWARPAGSFDAVHRQVDEGWAVYARYVGEDGAQ